MSDFFSQAKFITTEFDNYFSSKNLPWGQKKPKLYQHTDLVPWKGLPMFLKDFEIDSVEDAKLYFTSLGCIDIYINGKRLEGAEMKPGWSTYNKRALYMCKDVSSMLTVGKNRILAVVSTGWYTGRIAGGIYGEDSPAAMLSLVCGGKTVAATDESWLCTVGGQIKTADIWDGEYRDGREDNYTDISRADYEPKDWENAEIYDYKGEVTPFIGSEV
ncbi:MAG: alpha-L-rhamnosidase N-terminal domain-containing protein, partial [Clostridia bacterium]|nr:alpha-L-rhamnosidase N-terminal domain-containing protein [Clostridia bacterium]